MLAADSRAKIQELAHAVSPQEACGIINDRGEVIAVENLADNPDESFILNPTAWVDHKSVECIWHSHTDGSSWSLADIKSCKQLGVPFYLFQLPEGKEYYYDPKSIESYEGREWLNWTSDCYTLIRDWYRQELSIELPDFERELIDSEGVYTWLSPEWDMYRSNLSEYGFVNMGNEAPLEYGDIVLMNYRSSNPNHAAVYANPVENHILDHLLHRLSGYRVYGYEQRKITDSIWRLPDVSSRQVIG
jgi:cell wall-associated NlpC family hydrolase